MPVAARPSDDRLVLRRLRRGVLDSLFAKACGVARPSTRPGRVRDLWPRYRASVADRRPIAGTVRAQVATLRRVSRADRPRRRTLGADALRAREPRFRTTRPMAHADALASGSRRRDRRRGWMLRARELSDAVRPVPRQRDPLAPRAHASPEELVQRRRSHHRRRRHRLPPGFERRAASAGTSERLLLARASDRSPCKPSWLHAADLKHTEQLAYPGFFAGNRTGARPTSARRRRRRRVALSA